MPPEQPWRASWPDRTHGPWDLDLQFGEIAGRWELVGVHVHRKPADLTSDDPESSGPLTTAVLRSIPWSRLTAEWRIWRAQFNREAVGVGAVWLTDLAGNRLDSEEAVAALDRMSGPGEGKVGRPVYWTDQRLQELARVYAKAWAAGQNPTSEVATHFHKSSSMAAKLVSMARRRGQLPQTKPGKAGWLPQHGHIQKEKKS